MTLRVTITPGPGITLLEHLAERVGLAVERAGHDGEAQAKILAPVDTGRLRNGIAFRMTGPTSGELTTDVEYAAYVEYGTRYMAARPHMIPGREAARVRLERELALLR